MNHTGFILIGERLNTHRERFALKVAERDAAAITKLASRQVRAGVTHLDINTGGNPDTETANILWVLETLLPVLAPGIGLSLDSASPDCLARALEFLNKRPGSIVNALTLDSERLRAVLPLVIEHETDVIAMLASGSAPPRSVQERLSAAEALHAALSEAGISENRCYFDPQVLPLAFDPQQPQAILETVLAVRRRWPRVRTLAGLSNISFNLPNRALLNRSFLGMLLAAGIDGLIFDPCDAPLRQTLLASRALLGQDAYLATYLHEI